MATDHKLLKISFHGQILDHLGIQMYQSPVAALAELISNAWDADAEIVKISLPADVKAGSAFTISDNGSGMTFSECEQRYLKVGANRREKPDAHTATKQRPVLGRKGIGKFAGFGIAKTVRIDTVSAVTGERTVFEMKLDELRQGEYMEEGGNIPVVAYEPPDDKRKSHHGTIVTLTDLTIARRPPSELFARSMARRFLLHTKSDDFKILVDGTPIPDAAGSGAIELLYPRDYTDEQKAAFLMELDGDWGIETLPNGKQIRWKMTFYKKPIDDEELRGISVFAHYKLAQRPFFFNLTGGLGGQHGLEYMSGQVEADYVDELPKDLIATERQRINWESEEAAPLLVWGQTRIKDLLRLWKDKRAEAKIKLLNEKVAPFQKRIDRLQKHERKVVEKALRNLARIPALEDEDFFAMGDSLLLAWEDGRLRDLISSMAEASDMGEKELLGILAEAQVLTALHTAEAVRAKLDLIAGLRDRLKKRDLENAIRDYIAENPWLIDPIWETFQVEKSVEHLVKLATNEAELDKQPDWSKRVDLVLSSGDQLLVLEFMRPGITVDYDHLSRFEFYVRTIDTELKANTGGQFKRVAGYLVADNLAANPTFMSKLEALGREHMQAVSWKTLLTKAAAKWKDFLLVLLLRAPEDERLADLAKEIGLSAKKGDPQHAI